MKVRNFEANERYTLSTEEKLGPRDPTLLSHLVNLLRCQRGSLDGVVA